MDRKDSSVKFKMLVRSAVAVIWAGISTVVYSTACMISTFFSRNFALKIARAWNVHLLWVGGVRFVVNGAEKIDSSKRYVIVANHQSSLDIPLLISALPVNLSFIAKKELFLIPFLGWGMAMIGHIKIDRENARKARSSIDNAIRTLKAHHTSLVLFPEGTRSVDGKLGEFKKGSFSLAVQAGVPVVPVTIRNANKILPKKALTLHPGTIYIDIGEPIDAEIIEKLQKSEIAELVRGRIKSVMETCN